jgi:hypothetical protein
MVRENDFGNNTFDFVFQRERLSYSCVWYRHLTLCILLLTYPLAANAVSIDILSSQQDSSITDIQNRRQQHFSLRSRGLVSNDLLQIYDSEETEDEHYIRELQQVTTKYPKTILGECMAGNSCTSNTDCENGLTCSVTNTTFLQEEGLDPIKAYCDTNAGNATQNVCYRKSLIDKNKRCYRNIAPKPLDKCPTDTTKRSCSVGPVICCRTLKRIDRATGRKICNPRTCTYSRTCSCTATTSWACEFHDPQNCVTGCYN